MHVGVFRFSRRFGTIGCTDTRTDLCVGVLCTLGTKLYTQEESTRFSGKTVVLLKCYLNWPKMTCRPPNYK